MRRHQKRKNRRAVNATASVEGRQFRLAAEVQLQAQAEDADGPPKFTMVAYTGGAMQVAAFWHPVVLELSGFRVENGSRPILRDHNPGKIVGHTTQVVVRGRNIEVSGRISGGNEHAEEVINSSQAGFPWRASVGAIAERVEFVAPRKSVSVNGRRFVGPIYVARASSLQEVSFVALAADDKTSARVAADRPGGHDMNFEAWVAAQGFVLAELDDQQRASLQAAYDREIAAQADPPPADPPPADPPPADPPPADPPPADSEGALRAQRDALAGDVDRVRALRNMEGMNEEILAQAIREGWDANRAELEVLRTNRVAPVTPFQANGDAPGALVLECAVRRAGGEPAERIEADSQYTPQILDEADRFRNLGLKAFMAAAMRLGGVQPPQIHESENTWVQAAFSTTEVAGILSNVANKMMMAAFTDFPFTATLIARALTANDFKIHTGYRLGGENVMQDLGPGGEIKYATISETSFQYRVRTQGGIISLTREMIVNDDMGAFNQLPQKMGRDAARQLEMDFWDFVEANAGNFFSAANNNYIEGADSALGLTGLDRAVQTLLEMVDQDGNPISADARWLVVPPALAAEAQRIYASDNLISVGGGSTAERDMDANIYRGRYDPRAVPHLKTDPARWYLWGDPSDIAAAGIAYLRGRATPIFEQIAVPADRLGMAMRIYFDYGITFIDKQGAVKSKGTA